MTIGRFIVLLSFLLASVALARADGIPTDPNIDVSDPPCVSDCPPAAGLTFAFGSNAAGGGIVQFTNASGQNWTNLLITAGGDPFFVDESAITCTSNAFLNCAVEDLEGGMSGIFLSGVLPSNSEFGARGIFSGDAFSINLNDVDSSGGSWGADRDFSAAANVPEPNTLYLLAIGLAGLLVRRKFRSPLATRPANFC
jgi:PEP-CTERM motif